MYRKLIKRHPVACAFFVLIWTWVIIGTVKDSSIAMGGLVATFVPTVYMEPNERKKVKGWVRTVLFLFVVFVLLEVLAFIVGWEAVSNTSWVAWALAIIALAFQLHKLWNWDEKYRDGIRQFFDRAIESNE